MAARETVPVLRVRQWMSDWDDVDYSAPHRRKPEPYIYVFGMRAGDLRTLSGISRRSTAGRADSSIDLGIQRRHDPKRSREISDFVKFGLPWSDMSQQKRANEDLGLLRKPGFLPTAIVINVLTSDDARHGSAVADSDAVKIEDSASGFELSYPHLGNGWEPQGPHPIEVIDGQHRLWAFNAEDDFELPVVAYRGLDVSWQAYLFYTINVKPKRINTSLAFDLYPLLRTEDWLERADALAVYRETRAQELTEVLWRYPESPWKDRIDMLGDHGRRLVSQAAWVRSLLASFIKPSEGARITIGGLFGAPVGAHATVLPWSRPQQAALLIAAWATLERAVRDSTERWAEELRHDDSERLPLDSADAAFVSRSSLLNTDQGVRAFMQVTNDLLFLQADALGLESWADDSGADEPSDDAVQRSLESLAKHKAAEVLSDLARSLATYDWRTSSAPGLSSNDAQLKARFRGSSGYRYLRQDLLAHISSSPGPLSQTAQQARSLLEL